VFHEIQLPQDILQSLPSASSLPSLPFAPSVTSHVPSNVPKSPKAPPVSSPEPTTPLSPHADSKTFPEPTLAKPSLDSAREQAKQLPERGRASHGSPSHVTTTPPNDQPQRSSSNHSGNTVPSRPSHPDSPSRPSHPDLARQGQGQGQSVPRASHEAAKPLSRSSSDYIGSFMRLLFLFNLSSFCSCLYLFSASRERLDSRSQTEGDIEPLKYNGKGRRTQLVTTISISFVAIYFCSFACLFICFISFPVIFPRLTSQVQSFRPTHTSRGPSSFPS
jgi:hypothetical protein